MPACVSYCHAIVVACSDLILRSCDVIVIIIIIMSSEMTSSSTDRPMPVVPVASDPHGPVIVLYTVLTSYLVTFILGLVGNTLVLYVVSRYSAIRNRSVSNYYICNYYNPQQLLILPLQQQQQQQQYY